MKTSTLWVPAAVLYCLSTVQAWGRDNLPPVTGQQGQMKEAKGGSAAATKENILEPSVSRRFDYRQSLKKPFLYNGEIPFWSHHGNSFVAEDFIRLAPSVPRLRGSVWRTTANEYKEWEVEFSFKAYGQGQVGGKGLAFWYTQERAIEGKVFGNKARWTGLGVFLDTSDPANHRSNSVIYGIINDGTKDFPKNPTQNTNSFGGCLRDYKNSAGPVVVRISYVGSVLRVAVDTVNKSKGKRPIICFEQKDLDLPVGYHFGISAEAAESGSPDDHDLFSFEFFEVNPPAKAAEPLRPHEEEMIKKGKKAKVEIEDKEAFEEVQKIVEEQEQKLKEETDGPTALSAAQVAATVSDTQFRIIESLNNIHNKLESLGAPVQPPESTAKSLEDINQRISNMASSLQAMENVVQGLVDYITTQGGLPAKGAAGPDLTKVLKEELHNLNAKMEDMDTRQSFQHRLTQNRLVSSTSWISYVVFLIIAQVLGMSAYMWYKKKSEINEKKFL